MHQSQGESTPLRTDKMDPVYSSEDIQEEKSSRIPTKCSVGRVINICIAVDFLLIVITALVVAGSLGSLNLTVRCLDVQYIILCLEHAN